MANRPIDFYYDYKSWLDPIINKRLKNYQLPHCFKITRVHGTAVCVHKPYSTSPEWLPPEPKTRVSEDQMQSNSTGFSISEFDLFGGSTNVVNRVIRDGRNPSETELVLNPVYREVAERGEVFRHMQDRLQAVYVNTVCESIGQMENEAQQGYMSQYNPIAIRNSQNDNGLSASENLLANADSMSADKDDINLEDISEQSTSTSMNRHIVGFEQRQTIQKAMFSQATIKEGYVFWLDYSKVDCDWEQTVPRPVNYYTEVTNSRSTTFYGS